MSARGARWVRLSAFALLAAFAACDRGPSGPGTMNAVVEGSGLGAVVVEVVGEGITGFEGLGDTQAYGALVSAVEERHRVVLVDARGGRVEFGIEVEDLSVDLPTVTVLFAANTDNLTMPANGVSASVRK